MLQLLNDYTADTPQLEERMTKVANIAITRRWTLVAPTRQAPESRPAATGGRLAAHVDGNPDDVRDPATS